MKATHPLVATLAGLVLLTAGPANTQQAPEDITISVAIVNNHVIIRDGDGADATYFVARPGQRVIWEASTGVATFDLEFFRFSQGGKGAGVLDSGWPFGRRSADDRDAGQVDYRRHTTIGAKKFNPRVAANGRGVYKYTIAATPPTGDPIVLDPIIIIEPGSEALRNEIVP